MGLLGIVVLSAVCLTIAYVVYGSLLARLLKLDDKRVTPAVSMRDDLDYQPIEPKFLLSQHFSAIAAAGPIVGPILAGVMFGWLPALLWILIGSIFIGGVHDFTALVASIRHKARSIAEVVREHMSRRSYLLFLIFVYIALIYIIVAFTDLVATAFVDAQNLTTDPTAAVTAGAEPAAQSESIVIEGGAIATSSLIYLALPVMMGLLLRFTKLSVGWATLIFLPLVGLAIWIGPHMPLDLKEVLKLERQDAIVMWDVLLLGYCLVAGAVPVWLLLQPRGHLGGYFLYIALIGGMLGVLVQGVGSLVGAPVQELAINYDAFTSWNSSKGPLIPILFITVACGACSGFHCLIASGTTSKQLRRESDAKLIGYGAMLIEAMVAVLALSCVMILTTDGAKGKAPNFIFAQGLGGFLATFGIPAYFAVSFGLLAFTTFVYDTLDVCTRLGRFIVQELTGWHGAFGRWLGAAITAGLPLLFVTQTLVNPDTKAIEPAWKVFWWLFGASNQLLAALALVGITVWLWRTYRARWVWLVMALPTAFMYVMSTWALLRFMRDGFINKTSGAFEWTANPVPWVALVLVGLAALLLVEAVIVFIGKSTPPQPKAATALA